MGTPDRSSRPIGQNAFSSIAACYTFTQYHVKDGILGYFTFPNPFVTTAPFLNLRASSCQFNYTVCLSHLRNHGCSICRRPLASICREFAVVVKMNLRWIDIFWRGLWTWPPWVTCAPAFNHKLKKFRIYRGFSEIVYVKKPHKWTEELRIR